MIRQFCFINQIFNKYLLPVYGSIWGYFCLLREILHRKAGDGDVVGKGKWGGIRPFEKSVHLVVGSPVKKAFLNTIQADHFCTPFFHDAY